MKSFLILFLFSLYSQTLSTESNKRVEKYQTWAQRRTLNQERLTINNTFTDRMTESLKDFYKEIEKTDLIRKAFMYGSMNDNTRAFGQLCNVYFKRGLNHLNHIYQSLINTEEMFETDQLKQSIAKFNTSQYLSDITRVFGKPDQKWIDMPPQSEHIDMVNLIEGILKSGSALEKATALMAHLGIELDIYRHLVNSPQYIKNDLAVNALCIGIGFEEVCTALEYFLDSKGLELSKNDQDKLTKLYGQVFKAHWDSWNKLYKTSQSIV